MSVLAAASASALGYVAGIIANLIDFDLFKSNNNKKFANYYYCHSIFMVLRIHFPFFVKML